MAEQTPEQILQSIREDNKIVYDAFIDLYNYFQINASNMATFDILKTSEISVTEDGVAEKEMAMAERRAAMMAKFAEKYDYYVETLTKYQKQLSQEQLKQVEKHLKPKSYSREDRAK